jgi:hypothetical protein
MRDFKGMKRQRGRNNRGGAGSGGKPQQHNANRAFDSNGPEGVKVRGAAQSVYEKYQQLARDATSSGDRVLAENYLQHAEHYFRVLRAIQPNRPVSDIIGKDAYSAYEIDFEAEPEEQPETPEATQAEAPAEGEGGEQGQGEGRRDRFENRPRDDRPREDRPRDDRPREDRQRDDRPRDDRPRDNNQNRDGQGQGQGRRDRWRDRDDRPRDDRPRDDRPREDRPRDDRPVRTVLAMIAPVTIVLVTTVLAMIVLVTTVRGKIVSVTSVRARIGSAKSARPPPRPSRRRFRPKAAVSVRAASGLRAIAIRWR